VCSIASTLSLRRLISSYDCLCRSKYLMLAHAVVGHPSRVWTRAFSSVFFGTIVTVFFGTIVTVFFGTIVTSLRGATYAPSDTQLTIAYARTSPHPIFRFPRCALALKCDRV